MAKGFKKKGKFIPTGSKKRKSSEMKSISPFGIKLFKEKEPVSSKQVLSKIKSDLKVRDGLKEENTMLVSEIEDNKMSEFNIPRRKKIQKNNEEVKRLGKDIKKNFNALNKEQKQKLPIEVISDLRTL